MIKEKIRVHGGESFEIDLGYVYNNESRSSTYDIDAYIFTPRSLDINQSTYSKKKFFQDLKTNIRFTTPIYELKEIIEGDNHAFKKLNESLEKYLKKSSKENATQLRYHIKMFVSIFSSSLSKHVRRINSKKDISEKQILLNELFSAIDGIVISYRDISKKLKGANVKEREKNVYLFGNEFLSYSIEKQFLALIKKLSKRKDDILINELEFAQDYLCKELEYQKLKGILRLKTNNNKSNEDVVYRRGILRKFAEDRLFLNTRTEKEGVMIEQIIFSLAAGFAMIFATGIAFFSQQYYGNFTMPFFIALVISYMAKDRIKEIVRSKINNRIQAKYFFDHRTKIISGDQGIGICKESFNFVEENKIPTEVKTARKREHLTEIENDWKGENVMRYQKRVTIYNKRFKKVFKEYEISGIKDIIRLNTSRFTTKMSTPYLPFYGWDEKKKEVTKIKGEKVYHFNIILVFKYKKESHFKRYRIFLNKNGIKRIEKVSI